MKIKMLLYLLQVVQCTYFLFVLFFAPTTYSLLTGALDNIKAGDLSTATERISNGMIVYRTQGLVALAVALGTLITTIVLTYFVRQAQIGEGSSEVDPEK